MPGPTSTSVVKFPLNPEKPDHQRPGQDLNLGMIITLSGQAQQDILGYSAPSMVAVSRPASPPKAIFLFQQHHFKTLIRQIQGRIHAGNAAADNQRPLVDRNSSLS